MSFSLASLQQVLAQAPATDQYVIGLSGGVDSIVLLHAVVQLRDSKQIEQNVSAIHVNHGIHEDANEWQSFCESCCDRWQVPLTSQQVVVASTSSLENAARESRYQAFSALLPARAMLLLAHHQDDQLETLLLRLLRGAGPAGLKGMPRLRNLGQASLFRPLLEFTRAQILQYAEEESLQWIEDSSNQQLHHDRNYLRQQVFPLLEARWPSYRESWSKSLGLLGEAAETLQEITEQDYSRTKNAQGRLQLSLLQSLSKARQRLLLRYWLQGLGLAEPGWNQMAQIVEKVLTQKEGGGSLQLQDCWLQVFNDELFALKSLPTLERNLFEKINIEPQARLLPGNGYLDFQPMQGKGLSARCRQLELRYRQGGESISLAGRPTKTLKKLFQECEIPPWLRDRVPLLFSEGELVCVPGLGIAEDAAAKTGEHGYEVCWQPPEFEYRSDSSQQNPALRAPNAPIPD